jgi:hypothetical protein
MAQSGLEAAFAAAWVVRCPDLPYQSQFVCPAWRSYAEERKAQGLVKAARPMVADFAWPDAAVVVEIQGGTWVSRSGHTSGKGVQRDLIKSALAQMGGWLCIGLTSDMINEQWLARLEILLRSRL